MWFSLLDEAPAHQVVAGTVVTFTDLFGGICRERERSAADPAPFGLVRYSPRATTDLLAVVESVGVRLLARVRAPAGLGGTDVPVGPAARVQRPEPCADPGGGLTGQEAVVGPCSGYVGGEA